MVGTVGQLLARHCKSSCLVTMELKFSKHWFTWRHPWIWKAAIHQVSSLFTFLYSNESFWLNLVTKYWLTKHFQINKMLPSRGWSFEEEPQAPSRQPSVTFGQCCHSPVNSSNQKVKQQQLFWFLCLLGPCTSTKETLAEWNLTGKAQPWYVWLTWCY